MIVLIQKLEEVCKGFWRVEVVYYDRRVVIRQPVRHHRRAPVYRHTALMEWPPQLLCHVIWTPAILQRQVEFIACNETHELWIFASSSGCVLQIFREMLVVQALPIRVYLERESGKNIYLVHGSN